MLTEGKGKRVAPPAIANMTLEGSNKPAVEDGGGLKPDGEGVPVETAAMGAVSQETKDLKDMNIIERAEHNVDRRAMGKIEDQEELVEVELPRTVFLPYSMDKKLKILRKTKGVAGNHAIRIAMGEYFAKYHPELHVEPKYK